MNLKILSNSGILLRFHYTELFQIEPKIKNFGLNDNQTESYFRRSLIPSYISRSGFIHDDTLYQSNNMAQNMTSFLQNNYFSTNSDSTSGIGVK